MQAFKAATRGFPAATSRKVERAGDGVSPAGHEGGDPFSAERAGLGQPADQGAVGVGEGLGVRA